MNLELDPDLESIINKLHLSSYDEEDSNWDLFVEHKFTPEEEAKHNAEYDKMNDGDVTYHIGGLGLNLNMSETSSVEDSEDEPSHQLDQLHNVHSAVINQHNLKGYIEKHDDPNISKQDKATIEILYKRYLFNLRLTNTQRNIQLKNMNLLPKSIENYFYNASLLDNNHCLLFKVIRNNNYNDGSDVELELSEIRSAIQAKIDSSIKELEGQIQQQFSISSEIRMKIKRANSDLKDIAWSIAFDNSTDEYDPVPKREESDLKNVINLQNENLEILLAEIADNKSKIKLLKNLILDFIGESILRIYVLPDSNVDLKCDFLIKYIASHYFIIPDKQDSFVKFELIRGFATTPVTLELRFSKSIIETVKNKLIGILTSFFKSSDIVLLTHSEYPTLEDNSREGIIDFDSMITIFVIVAIPNNYTSVPRKLRNPPGIKVTFMSFVRQLTRYDHNTVKHHSRLHGCELEDGQGNGHVGN